MCIAARNRDKIGRDWRFAIGDFCDWIIGSTKRWLYNPGLEDQLTNEEAIQFLKDSRIRKIREMGDTFDIALKVKQMIFTDEEHEGFKRRMEEMCKIAEKAVQNVEKKLAEEEKENSDV